MARFLKWEWIAILLAASILSCILFIKPIIGVADNGDFRRIMGTVGLEYIDPAQNNEDKFYNYTLTQYHFAKIGIGGYLSTEVFVVYAATLLNRIVLNHELFDIRFLAAIYSILLLLSFYLILTSKLLKSSVTKIAAAALFLWAFLDVGYTAYYNSLFGEPMSFVFLLLTTALALRITEQKQPKIVLLVLFFSSAIFLVGSKVQNAPIGLIIGLFGLRMLLIHDRNAWKKSAIWLTALLFVVSIGIYMSAPIELKGINQYQSVFYGILKDSHNPQKDLEELGLSPSLAVLAGTNYFTPDTVISQQDPLLTDTFYSRISHGKIALFYLKHPLRYLQKLEVTAHNAMMIRAYYLGNYEQSEHLSPGKISYAYSTWSEFKKNHLPHTLWFFAPFFAAYFFILLMTHLRQVDRAKKLAIEIFMMIGLVGIITFVVPILGDGEADIGKHLFLFNACFDVMLVSSLVWLVHLAMKRIVR